MNHLINYKVVLTVLSRNLFILTSSLLVSCLVAIIYSENIWPFVFTAIVSLLAGLMAFLSCKGFDKNEKIQRRDAYLTVTLSWLIIGLIGCLPYLFSGAIPGFVNALFESVSGFTTTGSSILTDIESLPKSILFWRSLTHWIGGIGIIVLVIVIMPSLQIGGYHLFTLESSLQDKIQSKIKSVGRRLLLIYIILTLSEVALLMAGKMSLYESICHAFGTVATGGFSPKNSSIGEYSSYIQYVIMIFMVLAGTNFAIHYYLYKREFRKIKENEELRFYLMVIIVMGLIITGTLVFKMQKSPEMAFRESFFQVISIITCTGFATADYLEWPEFAWGLVFIAMFFGGSTGSTAGGIKMVRHLMALKNIRKVFRQSVLPNAIIPIRLNKHIVNDQTNYSILTFISAYFTLFATGSILLILMGIDGQTASSSVATCMAGIGPGIGTVGPASNFAHLPQMAKVVLTFLMLVGRLEIYTVLILFSREFWKN